MMMMMVAGIQINKVHLSDHFFLVAQSQSNDLIYTILLPERTSSFDSTNSTLTTMGQRLNQEMKLLLFLLWVVVVKLTSMGGHKLALC
jgi:hypothetical protein